jgi:hypothetical protein
MIFSISEGKAQVKIRNTGLFKSPQKLGDKQSLPSNSDVSQTKMGEEGQLLKENG